MRPVVVSTIAALLLVLGCSDSSDSEGSVPLEKLNQGVRDAFCEAWFQCPGKLPRLSEFVRYPSEAECKAGTDASGIPLYDMAQLADGMRAGRLTYDGTRAPQCFAALKTAICAGLQEMPAECNDMFIGKVPAGGACVLDDECAGGPRAGCQTEYTIEACYSTCVEVEFTCGDKDCAEGEYCRSVSFSPDGSKEGECRPRAAEGQPCDSAADFCLDGLKCDLSTGCVKQPPMTVGAEGEECDDLYAFCLPGLVCHGIDDDGVGACGVPSVLNGKCDRFSQCQNGLYCTAPGLCVRSKADGESCTSLFECLSGICEYGADSDSKGVCSPTHRVCSIQ